MADGALMGSQQPSLKMRNHQMNARQEFRGGLLAAFQVRNLVLKAVALEGQVSEPPIGMHGAPRYDSLPDKGHQVFSRSGRNLTHANPADALPILLRGNDHKRLLQVEASWQALFFAADVAFIHFDPATEQVSPRPNHGPTQLVEPCPGRFITLQTEDPLQSHSARTILLRRHPPHGAKPNRQGSSCVLEDGSRRYRCLRSASRAFQQNAADGPCFSPTATGTEKPFRPTQLRQILSASCPGREARLQLKQLPRIVFHRPKHYRLYEPESSRYLAWGIIDVCSISRPAALPKSHHLSQYCFEICEADRHHGRCGGGLCTLDAGDRGEPTCAILLNHCSR